MDVVSLAQALVRCPSVTPDEAGCLDIIASVLKPAGFTCRRIDSHRTSNLVATLDNGKGVSILLNGHCDVVPPGHLDSWQYPPFSGEISDGFLHGRGAADMKGSLATMVCAAAAIGPTHSGQLTLLVTSDEEGDATYGTGFALNALLVEGARYDYALVGEPTSEKVFGDTIKVGRRGSLSARLKILGKQGHVAYPHLALNPIHTAADFISELSSHRWDNGTAEFDPSSLQIANISAGTGALNVIPGELKLDFNIRYQPEQTVETIQAVVLQMLARHGLEYEIEWLDGAKPFVTKNEKLIAALSNSINAVTGVQPKLSTGGGTSDARFIAAAGIPVCEFGPLNATIHAVNERISTNSLIQTEAVYAQVLRSLN